MAGDFHIESRLAYLFRERICENAHSLFETSEAEREVALTVLGQRELFKPHLHLTFSKLALAKVIFIITKHMTTYLSKLKVTECCITDSSWNLSIFLFVWSLHCSLYFSFKQEYIYKIYITCAQIHKNTQYKIRRLSTVKYVLSQTALSSLSVLYLWLKPGWVCSF